MGRFVSSLLGVCLLSVCVAGGASVAFAHDSRGHGHGYGHDEGYYDWQRDYSYDDRMPPRPVPPAGRGVEPSVPPSPRQLVPHDYRFGSDDVTVILSWIFANAQRHSHSWEDLPPGLEMRMRGRGELRPGERCHGLPPGLSRRLGPPPEGYGRVVVGRDVLLVALATGVVVDILRGVF